MGHSDAPQERPSSRDLLLDVQLVPARTDHGEIVGEDNPVQEELGPSWDVDGIRKVYVKSLALGLSAVR